MDLDEREYYAKPVGRVEGIILTEPHFVTRTMKQLFVDISEKHDQTNVLQLQLHFLTKEIDALKTGRNIVCKSANYRVYKSYEQIGNYGKTEIYANIGEFEIPNKIEVPSATFKVEHCVLASDGRVADKKESKTYAIKCRWISSRNFDADIKQHCAYFYTRLSREHESYAEWKKLGCGNIISLEGNINTKNFLGKFGGARQTQVIDATNFEIRR